MGILNVTPDSFFDGGRFSGKDAALARAHELVDAGAAIIDVGGQSYSADNTCVAEEEELRRITPVLEALAAERLPAAISVDTYRARVAREALSVGAALINDCSGLSDPDLASTVAGFDAGLVVMHLRGALNRREPEKYVYGNAVAEIADFLRERCEAARRAGVARESIVVDPGLEFGKEPSTDLEILRRFGDFAALGYPVLLAASRKNFMRRILGKPFEELLGPSLAAVAVAWYAGCRIFRVHDVRETAGFLGMLRAIRCT
jgi:dihydropteroate synthase